MEERFTLYGGNVSFIETGAADNNDVRDSVDPVHGPFSNEFRWVRLQGEGDPIKLSSAQAAVFKALWDFGGQPQEAHVIMAQTESAIWNAVMRKSDAHDAMKDEMRASMLRNAEKIKDSNIVYMPGMRANLPSFIRSTA